MITIYNYYKCTFGVFIECKKPKREADHISYCKDTAKPIISSDYWYGKDKNGEYIIRYSDHWVKYKLINNFTYAKKCKMISSCNWQIKTKIHNKEFEQYGFYSGKCYLKKMKQL